jgi:DNA polymerase III sliding clamp (beta) subunit (PCNA family)
VKFAAPVSALDAAVSRVVMAADKKLDTPLRIVADKSVVVFCVNNSRAAVSITATTSALIEEAGQAVISGWRYAALLSGFNPRSVIKIETTATALTITSGDSVYRLQLLPNPPAGLVINNEIGRADLATADCLKLFEVVAAADTERTRFFLGGVHLHNADGRVIAVSTNGVKLLSFSVASDDRLSTDDRLIIPAAAVEMTSRLLRQTRPDQVTLRRSRAVFSASAPGFEIVTGMIDAAYPDYRLAMPRAGNDGASCQRAELLGALARLKAVANGEMLVALTWAGGEPMRLFMANQPTPASILSPRRPKARGWRSRWCSSRR